MGTSQDPAKFYDYEGFVDKFRPRRTTDDCYTPPEIYRVVLDYVANRYGVDPARVSRPFWPGGDYEREDYDGLTVVDNPPFSLLARIIDFFQGRGVPFFLFAPTLTCLSGRKHLMDINHIVCHTSITYENGRPGRDTSIALVMIAASSVQGRHRARMWTPAEDKSRPGACRVGTVYGSGR